MIHMVKSIRFWVAAVLLTALAGCMIIKYCIQPAQQRASEPVKTASSFIPVSGTEKAHKDNANETEPAESPEEAEKSSADDSGPDASVPFITEHKVNEITGKMREVVRYSSDLIGWIYIADSDIDYPVVQGRDNQYYLHHTPDGRENQLGTIFLSYKCTPDFSGALNILYGHNMQYGMFGDIRKFKEREEFDKHRYGWLFTKEALYRIDFFALSIVSAYDRIYDIPADSSEWKKILKDNSMYYTEPELKDNDPVVALSTCASDFKNARALFAGKLIWKQKINIQ